MSLVNEITESNHKQSHTIWILTVVEYAVPPPQWMQAESRLVEPAAQTQRRELEGNFIAVLCGKERLACNADLGCDAMVAIKMGVVSFRQSKTLLWDAKEEKVKTA